jgi:hypothetical protein
MYNPRSGISRHNVLGHWVVADDVPELDSDHTAAHLGQVSLHVGL